MNTIVNKPLSAGDKFVLETHLKQPGFAYSACGPCTKNRERIEKFKETGDFRYIYLNELDKACFQLDMAHGDFKDVNRRTAGDKVLRDKAFNIAKNPKYGENQQGLASVVYKFFGKITFEGTVKNENFSDKELAEELRKPIIRKFEKKNVHSPFVDNILGADVADMQLISKFNKEFRFLLCVIDVYDKYAWVIPFKGKKGITITNVFKKSLMNQIGS